MTVMWWMENDMDRGLCDFVMAMPIRGNGQMINSKGSVSILGQMVESFKVNSETTKSMARVLHIGLMDDYTKENGVQICEMAVAFCRLLIAESSKAYSKTTVLLQVS